LGAPAVARKWASRGGTDSMKDGQGDIERDGGMPSETTRVLDGETINAGLPHPGKEMEGIYDRQSVCKEVGTQALCE